MSERGYFLRGFQDTSIQQPPSFSTNKIHEHNFNNLALNQPSALACGTKLLSSLGKLNKIHDNTLALNQPSALACGTKLLSSLGKLFPPLHLHRPSLPLLIVAAPPPRWT